MKKILITGANGFIGKNCLPLFLNKDFEIHAVSNNQMDKNYPYWHKANLLDFEQINNLIEKIKPDYLLHLAWVTTSEHYWNSLENLNWLQSGIEILKSFARNNGKKVLIAGTCAEYDWNSGFCSEEKTPTIPVTLYGSSKNSLQLLLKSFAIETGISWVWPRIFFSYGPFEPPEKLVSAVIRSLIRKEKFICKNGNLIRDFVHVHDVARAIFTLLENEITGVFNIGSGNPVIIKEIVFEVAKKLDSIELIEIDSSESVETTPVLIADTSKIKRDLGFIPTFNLDKGIENTIEWWIKNYYGNDHAKPF